MHSYKNEFYIRNLIHKNGNDVCKRDRRKRDGENDYEKFIGTEPNNQNNSGCRLPQFSISMKLSTKKRCKKGKQMGQLKPIQATATTTPPTAAATAAVAIVVDESNTFRIFIMIRCSFIHSGTWYKLHIRFMSA